LNEEQAKKLDELWSSFLARLESQPVAHPDPAPAPKRKFRHRIRRRHSKSQHQNVSSTDQDRPDSSGSQRKSLASVVTLEVHPYWVQ
jgi:hypothetical protein